MSARRLAPLPAVALLLALFATQSFAAGPAIEATSASAPLGQNATVELRAVDIASPGLGAWTVDVIFDIDVATAVSCSAVELGNCNTEYATGAVRISGASTTGLVGDSALGSIQFRCEAPGSTDLEVAVRVLADATDVNPRTINATVSYGTLACGVPAPTQQATATPTNEAAGIAGFGTGDGSGPGGGALSDLIIAGLAGAGIAWMIAGVVGMSWTRLTASPAASKSPRPAPTAAGSRPLARPRVEARSQPPLGTRFPSLPPLIEPPDTFLTRER